MLQECYHPQRATILPLLPISPTCLFKKNNCNLQCLFHHQTLRPSRSHHHAKGYLHLSQGPTSCSTDASSSRTSPSYSTRTSARTLTAASPTIWTRYNLVLFWFGGMVVAWRPLSFVLLLALLSDGVPCGVSLVPWCTLWVPTGTDCVQLVAWLCNVLPLPLFRLSGR